jgi:hypothetical protein
MITRCCTQRQFLLRPDRETNNAFVYCLGVAAQRFEIDVLLPVAMSNHHHTVIYDRYGRYPQFLEHFHKLLAKCQNALRGRWENFWSSEQTSVVRLVEPRDVMAKLVYAATNPVKDGLVERAHSWPGVNGLAALLNRRTLRARRPHYFFRSDGPMPESIELELVVPCELGPVDEVLETLRQLVTAVEGLYATDRARRGARLLGRRAVQKQSWSASPTTPKPRRGLRPQLAARSVWSRVEAIHRSRAFIDAYRAARERWWSDRSGTFPQGTYWLRRFMNVPLDDMTS